MTPKKPKNSNAVGKEGPAEAPSEEFKAFESLARQVLSVSKTELDKREDQSKHKEVKH